MQRRLLTVVFLGWAVLYSRHGSQWQQVGEAQSSDQCQQIMAAHVTGEAMQEMDGALAGQDADNPLREAAFKREVRNVAGRYRCEQY